MVALFCMPEGLLVNALKQPLQHCSQNLRGAPPTEIYTLFSPNSQWSGPIFCFNYTVILKARRAKIMVTVP